jgi:hypothetical protein
MLAAYNGHAGCTRLLLDGGADKEAKTKVRMLWLASAAYQR